MSLSKSNKNSASMMAEVVIQTALNLIVFSFVARELGPREVGIFGLVQAVFFVGFPLALVVNDQILLKFFVADERAPEGIQKSALKLKYGASALVYIATILLSYLFLDSELFHLIWLYALIHFVNIDLIYFFYFRAKEESQKILLRKICIFFPMAALKAYVVIFYQRLELLLLVYLLEAGLLSISAYYLFSRNVAFKQINGAATDVGELLRACWPIFTATLFITLYARVDQFMIYSMLPSAELGFYTVAVKVSEAASYLMAIYIGSQFPRCLLLRKHSVFAYEAAVVNLLRIGAIYSIFLVIFTYLGGQSVIAVVFGEEYIASHASLVIHMFGSIFICYGLVSTQWFVVEDLQIVRLQRVVLGLVLNVGLNLILIPYWGIVGAAVATVISQAFSGLIFNAISKNTKALFRIQMRSLYFGDSV